ncbi:MAG: PAS domain S-box protein [Desulfobulbaceae bacterium]|nr:PAS domain S-box protein [Desulfobulbaceae bacterium]
MIRDTTKSKRRLFLELKLLRRKNHRFKSSLRKKEHNVISDLETKLRQSSTTQSLDNATYQLLCQSMCCGVAIFCIDKQGDNFHLIEVNKAVERMERKSKEDLIGNSLAEIFPNNPELISLFKLVLHSGMSEQAAIVEKWDDWIYKWREANIFKLSLDKVVLVYSDSTEKQRYDSELQKQYIQLKTALEAAPDLIAIKNCDLKYTLVNKAFCDFFAQTEAQILGKNDYYLLPPSEATNQQYHDANVISRRVSELQEEEVTTPKGEKRWLRIEKIPLFDKSGDKCIGLLCSIRDITDQKKTAEALRESEDRYKRLVEGSPDILYIYSHKKGLLYWSAKIESILGYHSSVFMENPYLWHESIHPDDRLMVIEAISAATIGSGFDMEYRIRDAENNWHWIHDRHIAITEKDNDFIIEGLAGDITERKLFEEKLRKSHEQLEDAVAERTRELAHSYQLLLQSEKLSSLGKLAASIAHEFGSPIFGIRNFLKGLPERATLPKNDHKLVELAIRECDRMKDLLDGLRGFKRPTTNSSEQLNIHRIIDNILLLCQRNLKKKNIKVIKNYGSHIPEIYLIEDQIKQVILNFLDNAQEAIPDTGGTITLCTKVQNNMLTLSIADSGKGMDQETLARVFEPFVSSKVDSGGIGLGMSISSEIIAAHGGEIKVESEPEQGTIFNILLPIEKSQSVASRWDGLINKPNEY